MLAAAGACSCVWGSKGALDSMAAFSDGDDVMAYYLVCSGRASGRALAAKRSGRGDTKGLGEILGRQGAKSG